MVNIYIKIAGIVLAIVLILVLASKLNQWRRGTLSPQTIKRLRTLIKESAHYASMSQQDANPVYALLHANTALNLFSAAESLISSKEVTRISGINVDDMSQHLQWLQESALLKLTQACPATKPTDPMHSVAVSR